MGCASPDRDNHAPYPSLRRLWSVSCGWYTRKNALARIAAANVYGCIQHLEVLYEVADAGIHCRLFNWFIHRIIDQIFNRVDYNNDGRLEPLEIEIAILHVYNIINKRLPGWQNPPTRKQIQTALSVFDVDGNGTLDKWVSTLLDDCRTSCQRACNAPHASLDVAHLDMPVGACFGYTYLWSMTHACLVLAQL